MAVDSLPGIAEDDAPDPAWLAWQRRRTIKRWLMPVLGGFGLLFVWWALVVVLQVKPFIAPNPFTVLATLIDRFPLLMSNLAVTALESVLGFLIGNLIAVLTAILFVHIRSVEEALYPVAVLINSIPVVAKVPILLLLLGNGLAPKIAIAALIVYFPTLVNMTRGLAAINPQAVELMAVLSANRWEVFWKLRLYASLPYLFSALRIAASTAVIGAIVGEWIGSQVGVGALILQASYNFDSALLYATVIVGSAFSVAFFLLIAGLERVVVRWQVDP